MASSIIGYLSESGCGFIPVVPSTPLVVDAPGGQAFALHEWALDAERSPLSDEDIAAGAARGQVVLLSVPFEWAPGKVILCETRGTYFVSIAQAEHRLRQFVDARRREGEKFAQQGRHSEAHQAFDLARRVSNESDDYVRVWWTAQGLAKNALERAFAPQMPEHPLLRVEQLGLANGPAIFAPAIISRPTAGRGSRHREAPRRVQEEACAE